MKNTLHQFGLEELLPNIYHARNIISTATVLFLAAQCIYIYCTVYLYHGKPWILTVNHGAKRHMMFLNKLSEPTSFYVCMCVCVCVCVHLYVQRANEITGEHSETCNYLFPKS